MNENLKSFLPIFAAQGLAILTLIYADLSPNHTDNAFDAFLREATTDGPAALALCIIGFIAVRIARLATERDGLRLVDARIALLVIGSAIICLSLFLQSLQITFVPVLTISGLAFLVISLLIGSSNSRLATMMLLFILLSAASYSLFRFNAPLGGDYPLFAYLSYAVFGMLLEQLIR